MYQSFFVLKNLAFLLFALVDFGYWAYLAQVQSIGLLPQQLSCNIFSLFHQLGQDRWFHSQLFDFLFDKSQPLCHLTVVEKKEGFIFRILILSLQRKVEFLRLHSYLRDVFPQLFSELFGLFDFQFVHGFVLDLDALGKDVGFMANNSKNFLFDFGKHPGKRLFHMSFKLNKKRRTLEVFEFFKFLRKSWCLCM